MSRILRRPMFRGGPVSSYGTGIASGLANGGRVHLDIGGFLPNPGPLPMKLGAQLGQFNKINRISPHLIEEKEEETTEMFPTLTGMSFPRDAEAMAEPEINTTDEYVLKEIGRDPIPKLVKNENYEPPTRTITGQKRGQTFEREVELDEAELAERAEAEERAQGYLPHSGPAPMKGITQINNTPVDVNPETGNVETINNTTNEESTAISADDIRAQAALFDELLNEGYEKDKKSAQISDASDYALKFFQSTVGEGKGMKEAAGDVAGYALAKPSKTEAVKAGQKKTKQTATVMAINEALASNKSDRELDKMFAKMGLDEQMRTRLLNKRISLELAAGKALSINKRLSGDKGQDSDLRKLRKHTKSWAEDQGVPIGSVKSIITEKKEGSKLPVVTDIQSLVVEENKNAVFIDETSKLVYQVVEDENGNLKLKQIS